MPEGKSWGLIIISISLGAMILIGGIYLATQIGDKKIAASELSRNIYFSTEIIELTKDIGQNYFVNYRIKRQQFRVEAKAMMQPLLESDALSRRKEPQRQWLQLSKGIVAEGEIENILKIRGFKDVVSQVNNEKATVTVLAKELKSEEIIIIKNAVNAVTGLSHDRIDIITRD